MMARRAGSTGDKPAASRATTAAQSEAPRYQRIAEDLVAKIANGVFPLGGMLPPEVELSDRYRVSRYTVREALRQLETMGLVSRRQGAGTTVIAREPLERFVQDISSMTELLQYPENTRLYVVRATRLMVKDEVAQRLRTESGERWLRIDGVRRVVATSAPICTSIVFVRPEFADVLDDIGKSATPVAALIERRFGVRLSRVEMNVEAVLVSPEQSALLEVERGTPALLMTRRYFDQRGRLYEVSETCHPGPRFTYRLNLRRAGVGEED